MEDRSWLTQKNPEPTLDFPEKNNLVYVAFDEPQALKSSAPPVSVATSNIVEVRFYGRNEEKTREKRSITTVKRLRCLY